jgi:UPF0716 protein FxsA
MVNWRYVLAALLLVPLVDATFLVFVADAIGGVETVLLVVLTGLIGMLLVRAEGRHTLRKLQRTAARGKPPTDELLDGAFLIAAGAFLLTPGLVTDTLGFLFVLPVTRYPLRELLRRYVVVPYLDKKANGFVTGDVYIGGFPGGEDERDGGVGARSDGGSGGPGGPFGGVSGSAGGTSGSAGGTGGSTGGAGSTRGSDGDDDVYDVSDDEYSVET